MSCLCVYSSVCLPDHVSVGRRVCPTVHLVVCPFAPHDSLLPVFLSILTIGSTKSNAIRICDLDLMITATSLPTYRRCPYASPRPRPLTNTNAQQRCDPWGGLKPSGLYNHGVGRRIGTGIDNSSVILQPRRAATVLRKADGTEYQWLLDIPSSHLLSPPTIQDPG